MKNNDSRGLFVTFEGGEGGGKSTQVKLLSASLTEAGYEVITTREPGGTVEAEKIRDLLVQRDGGNWSDVAECLLFFAARTMHLRDLVLPALEEGKIVISDRFTDSTRAYQSYGHGFSLETLEAVKNIAIGNFEPDITFILDLLPEEGIKRSHKELLENQSDRDHQTEDRFERLDLSFHERLRYGYLEIAGKEPDRCNVIDATMSVEKVSEEIKKIVFEKL